MCSGSCDINENPIAVKWDCEKILDVPLEVRHVSIDFEVREGTGGTSTTEGACSSTPMSSRFRIGSAI